MNPRDDRFCVEALIGEGATSRVFRARDRQTGQLVAIKVLRESLLSSTESVECFQFEMELLSSLEHPHIPPVVGRGESVGGAPWYACPYAARGSLADRMVRRGKLDAYETAAHMAEILDAVHYLHKRRIVHRDVKPENVLIDARDVAVLGDFGIAVVLQEDMPLHTLRGTPSFLPPEQYDDRTVTPQTDLFGLGVTLFVALTGQSGMALLVSHLRTEALGSLPKWLRPIVDRATSLHVSDRYRSAWEMALELGDALD